MREVMEWTNDEIIQLIKAYKAHGVLWDPTHELYRVQTAKYEAWCELAELYGCEIADLRKKFNSIFASHRREKAKIRLGGRTTWFLYGHLSFLPNHMSCEESEEKSKKKSAVEEPEEQPDEPSSDLEEYEDNISNSPVHIIVKEETEVSPQSPPSYYRTKPPPAVLKKRKTEHDDEMYVKRSSAESKMLKRSKLYKKKDECDSFGEYIAISLRKHDERTRSMIKQAINNILFEQEMKKYNSGHYAVIYAAGDENPLIVPDECDK